MKPIGNLAKQIKNLRLKFNMSQSVFGKKLGISCKTISAYETGRSYPSLEVLEKIAAVYKVSFLELNGRRSDELHDALYKVDKSLTELRKLLDSGISL